MSKAKDIGNEKSPLDRQVGVYERGRNGGYFLKSHAPLRKMLTGVRSNHISIIKSYRKTGDKEMKAGLPSYTPCGYYGDEPRSLKSKLKYETKQVQLDFDGDKEGLEKIFNECKFITAAGISCGGKGMFMLVNTEGKDYTGYFNALAEYFLENYGKQVDLAVSSKNELRFISLPTEVITREEPTLWKLTKEAPEPAFTLDSVAKFEPGEVIEVPKNKFGKLHYHDLSSYAGVSNAHAVPVEKAAEYIAGLADKAFSKKSHLYNKPAAIREIVEKHYNVYSEQHGESAVRLELMKRDEITGSVEMPELVFSKTSSMEVKSLQVVRAVLSRYSIVVDKFQEAYKYNGTFWEGISESQLDHFLVACAEASGYPPSQAGTLTFRKNMLDLMKKEAGINQLSTDHTAFNLSNGIVVFKPDSTIEFSKHDKDRHFNYILDYEYDPKAKCPTFDNFINRVMPNKENQKLFFQYVASVFAPGRVEKMLFLLGSGANGKSTLFEVILALFGGAATTTNLNRLTTPDRSEKAAFQIYNKLLAISHDDKGPNDAELFKTLASRDPITMKSLYRDELQSDNYARLIVGMNSSPNIEATHGAQRRIIMIPMNIRIPLDEQNINLKFLLQKELSGIFNRIIEAHTSGTGIIQSEESKRATEELIRSNDIVQLFLDDLQLKVIDEADNDKHITIIRKKYPYELKVVGISELYIQFTSFCEDEGVRNMMRRKTFKTRLESVWYAAKRIKDERGTSISGWRVYRNDLAGAS